MKYADKTLIIKLGAMGDVIRTTPLLNILGGDIFWVTEKGNIPILPIHKIKQIININDAEKLLGSEAFDFVLSLDDEYEAANLASIVNKDEHIGSFIDDEGNISYTESSVEWFDMGLISRWGKKEADWLKLKNTKTWQEILFKMISVEFRGEEYIINFRNNVNPIKNLIGIENRAGERWPNKIWNKYDELAERLKVEDCEVRFFKQRDNIQGYIHDIAECAAIVTGDTLAMHIALALKKPTVAIFTCTSPGEIYDYGRLKKVVSPLLEKAFYKRDYVYEAVDVISLDEVYKALKSIL